MANGDGQLRKLAIVPAFNEAGMVARVIRDIRRHAPDFDVVVVDDGSTDTTAAHAEALARVEAAAKGSENLMPPILLAAKAGGTVGEISDVLRGVFGQHKETLTI